MSRQGGGACQSGPRPPQGSVPSAQTPRVQRGDRPHSETQPAYSWRCGSRHARMEEGPTTVQGQTLRSGSAPRPCTCSISGLSELGCHTAPLARSTVLKLPLNYYSPGHIHPLHLSPHVPPLTPAASLRTLPSNPASCLAPSLEAPVNFGSLSQQACPMLRPTGALLFPSR